MNNVHICHVHMYTAATVHWWQMNLSARFEPDPQPLREGLLGGEGERSEPSEARRSLLNAVGALAANCQNTIEKLTAHKLKPERKQITDWHNATYANTDRTQANIHKTNVAEHWLCTYNSARRQTKDRPNNKSQIHDYHWLLGMRLNNPLPCDGGSALLPHEESSHCSHDALYMRQAYERPGTICAQTAN